MSKGNSKSTNNAEGKPVDGSKQPVRRREKRSVSPEADLPRPSKAVQPETAIAKEENTPNAKKSKPKLTPPTADTHTSKELVPETTNMEVHHHPDLEHKPKPFKEYLLEGFMIFIAVMMGFIAENIREAIDNQEHVQQLTSQLARDLKADIASLKEIHEGESKIYAYDDSLFSILQQPLQKADTKKIQMLVVNCHSIWLFHQSAGAIAAIKNELHLKQFSNSEIISNFAKYEKHIELLQTAQNVDLQYQRSYLDPFITQHFTSANMAAAFQGHPVPNGQMRNLTQNDIDQLAANIVLTRVITHEILRDQDSLKNDATAMLQYIIRQYDLEKQ
jgi:hypothetical protein